VEISAPYIIYLLPPSKLLIFGTNDDSYLGQRSDAKKEMRIDAAISLPLNVFYGATVPACLLILRKQRPPERRDQVLLIYAARHCRELSAQNELRPQDVMRMLVHYHAYGDDAKVAGLAAEHSGRIYRQIDLREEDEVGRLEAEYQHHADKLRALDTELAAVRHRENGAKIKSEKEKAVAAVAKVEKQREKAAARRDERIVEARRRAEEDRQDVAKVGDELVALYADPDASQACACGRAR
jgi:type I restriction enzyme M protein